MPQLHAASFEESLSLLRHAADEMSGTYKDKGNEDLERTYFLALWYVASPFIALSSLI